CHVRFGGARASSPLPAPHRFRDTGDYSLRSSPREPEAHAHRSKIYVVSSRASLLIQVAAWIMVKWWHPFARLVPPVENDYDTGGYENSTKQDQSTPNEEDFCLRLLLCRHACSLWACSYQEGNGLENSSSGDAK
ncbi:unnamed protein product, partial [Ectocarpus sp. 4 AP-2014]